MFRDESMGAQPGFFDVDHRMKRLSDLGDQLEAFGSAVDFEIFRGDLVLALAYSRCTHDLPVSGEAHQSRGDQDAVCSLRRSVVNTASGVWADTAYRSAANEAFMEKHGFTSRVHRKKPKGRAMPGAIRRANNAKSKIRARVEHVFAAQKDRMDLFIRTIGIARAITKIGMANLVYNIKRLVCLRRRLAA